MKQFYPLKIIIAFCLGSFIPVQAQYTPIPDTNFEQFLIDQGIDSEATLDGQVLTNDIALVGSIDISFTSISDLSGIRDFIGLTSLKASQISLTSLDLTGMVNLQDLDLSMTFTLNTLILDDCTGLTDLDIRFTGLNSLDLSTCTSLSTIDLFRSYNLQELDVSGMTSITSINANESALTTLNVIGCSSLETIRIDETSIGTLDLRDNTALESLNIFDAGIQVINLSNCVNFESIYLSQCYDLQAIQHMNTTNLKNLVFENISSQINNIDLTSYPGLETIFLAGTSITSLDITSNPNITSISIYDSAINSVDLRNGNNTSITTFNAYGFDLGCISVDDPIYSAANWTNIGANVFFSEDCETLSVDEFSLTHVGLYPNPSSDFVFLSGLDQSMKYQIFSVDGKRLNHGMVNPEEGIAISNFTPGIYFLNLDGRTTFKFVKK